jgi:SAM-dependent methyltransferase
VISISGILSTTQYFYAFGLKRVFECMMHPHHQGQQEANKLKEFLKKWPSAYYFVLKYLGPTLVNGLTSAVFFKRYCAGKKCLNLGSGVVRIAPGVVNVDITPYEGVDIIADITNLPQKDNSVDCIICDQVLEHVPEYDKAVSEIKRILAPGGYCYIGTPFVFPFHASPSDFQRWTHAGMKKLFKEFDLVEEGPRGGPFSTLTVVLCYMFATLFSFGSERVYWFLAYTSTFIFFPIRYLDLIFGRLPFVKHMAPMLYFVFRKPE